MIETSNLSMIMVLALVLGQVTMASPNATAKVNKKKSQTAAPKTTQFRRISQEENDGIRTK
ncbi:MAG: hypothetical protein MRZ36_08130 [Eubacterium sp.]|nr:hypothetical protein [Eubacterium sp.]